MTPRTFHVAAILANGETVHDCESVIGLARKGSWRVSLSIAQAMRPGIVCREIEPFRSFVGSCDFHPLIVGAAEVLGGVNNSPILKRCPRVYYRARNIGLSARGDLVPIHGHVQPVRIHANVADAQRGVRRKLPLHSDIPLCGLRISVVRISGLLDCPTADLYKLARRDGIGELEKWNAVGQSVLIRVDRRLRIALVIVLQLPQIDHCEDAKARAKYCLVVFEWPVSQADTRIEVTHVCLPKTWGQCFLAVRHHGGTRHGS